MSLLADSGIDAPTWQNDSAPTGMPAQEFSEEMTGQEITEGAHLDVDMLAVGQEGAMELDAMDIEAGNEGHHHLLCDESTQHPHSSLDEPCLCHRARYQHQPHLVHTSPLQDLLRNFKYAQIFGGAAIPFFPDGRVTPSDLRVAAPSTEAEAHLVTNFLINLRHAVGGDLSVSAWNNLTALQQEQFRVLQAMLQCTPALVRAILQGRPTDQHSTLRTVANTVLSMESLAGVEEELWEVLQGSSQHGRQAN